MTTKECTEMKAKDSKKAVSRVICLPVLAMGLYLMAGSAYAQWQVVDNEGNTQLRNANSTLEEISRRIGETSASGQGQGSVTGNLRDIYRQQYIGSFQSSNDGTAAADEPKEKLTEDRPSASVTMTAEARCPQPSAQGVAQQQWQLCQEIVNTEMAQYNYSLSMYDLTKKRQEYLDELKNQRANIREHEIGKLEDNTNRILLLMSQMEIDRQQQRTYMDAYAARINYLQQVSRTLSQQALEGTRSSGGGGGLPGGIGAIIGGGALAIALEAARTNERSSGFFRRR